MDNLNWNLAITALALVISVATPFITTWLGNRHQLKMKKIEVLYQQKFSAFQSFCSFFQDGIKAENPTAYEQFCSACHTVKMLYPDETLVDNIDALIRFSHSDKYRNERNRIFNECLKILSKDLEELKSLFD